MGKWHVGNAKPSMLPHNRGFDSFFGIVGGGFDHYTKEAGGEIDLWRYVRTCTHTHPLCSCARTLTHPIIAIPLNDTHAHIDSCNSGDVQLTAEEIDTADHATNLFSREAVSVVQNHAAREGDKPLFL